MKLYKQIEKSFTRIEKKFEKDDMKNFMRCNYNDIDEYHFGLGTWIRNNLLVKNTKLYRLFIKSGITQKDDMSMLIIQLFYAYIKANKK